MAFTYDLTTDLGKVRLRIGDTVDLTADSESLTDAEINHALSLTSSIELAALQSAKFLLAQLRKRIDRSAAGVNSSQASKFDMLLELIAELQEETRNAGEMDCFAGQISQDRLDDAAEDTDYPSPTFSVGRDDKP